MEPEPVDAPQKSPAPVTTAFPGPDHRDMYILIAGLVVGLLLSPWLMGRFLDETAFDRWYYGGGPALAEYQKFITEHDTLRRAKHTELLDRLAATGATKEAVDEMQASFEEEGKAERKPYVEAIQVERLEHERWYRGLMLALVLAAVVLMFLEPLFELPGPLAALRRRLVTGRYVLLATWIGFALAKPHMVHGLHWLFAVLLVAMAVGAAAMAQKMAVKGS